MGVVVKIGELSTRSGCSVQTIRYYEKEGLIPKPARTESNYRVNDTAALKTLRFIKNCRAMDLTLGETKQLILLQRSPEETCESVNGLIDKHLDVVSSRIADLKTLQGELESLRQKCGKERSIKQCGILGELCP